MDKGRATILKRYESRLAGLAGQVGDRNRRLLGIVNQAIMAGLGDEQIEQEVKAASGHPPLTVAEIRHALRTARLDTHPLERDTPARRWTPPPPPPPPLGPGARSYVARMIERGRGATLESLAACSPVPIPNDPREMVCTFLETLFDDDDLLFAGKQTDAGKIGQSIRCCWDWKAALRSGEPPPPLLIPNRLSGREGRTKEGKPSYRCAACVAARHYCLTEFNAMPLEEQARFWAGVIASKTLPLRSLTFSGGKSLHGLIEVNAPSAEAWGQIVSTLLYAVCHPDAAPELQADRACKNPDRLTRLPGAPRPDKGTVQALLWLSAK